MSNYSAVGPKGTAVVVLVGKEWIVKFRGSTASFPDRDAAINHARQMSGVAWVH